MRNSFKKSWLEKISTYHKLKPIFYLSASLISATYSGKTDLSLDLIATVRKKVMINLNASN
jgi:hypothetical protein